MAFSSGLRKLKISNFMRNMACQNVKTSGILIIGDELLKGQVVDCNSPHITREFHKIGVKVKKISIIGDDVDEISNEIKIFSKNYDYVVTSGGIGPTHDDVTFEAVAKAFGVPLVLNGQLKKLCENFYRTQDANHPGMKLAKIPETAKLTYSEETKYPNVSIKNVYIFPGIPELFERSFRQLHLKLFKSDDTIFYSKVIYVNLTEDAIAEELSKLASVFPDVQVGSYPKLFDKSYKVKITIESTNKNSVDEASQVLLSKFPKSAIVNVDK